MERFSDGAPSALDTGSAVDPSTLSFIERISWFERQKPVEADNDNLSPHARDEQGSACFDCWALPDFMRN
ncbi:hypothetical protein IHQ71_17885 [Rhizobium sp. TH2]|uniref:hypothetical protein n=1 Tax=Rhizobium sp. TH2 TaxID=2775403 RepID=UPI0021578FFE|nr:hypothetical protein [Rhizobium sp. TH2]UVC07092.1 hypothetical protein IHQ71_17885 [Rhizobium sp. TH2]